MFDKSSIEVIILTYNRCHYLKSSVLSALNQTISGIKVTVLDNGSSDDTQGMISELQTGYPNLNYKKNPVNIPFCENVEVAKTLITSPYVMFFHDDDVLHPQYIEAALRVLNDNENVDIICSNCITINGDEAVNHNPITDVSYKKFTDKYDFITYVYAADGKHNAGLLFPNVIYKTENIVNVKVEQEKYGKLCDKPFVLNSVKDGIAVQLNNSEFLKYRLHPQQDTNAGNGPFMHEIIAHNKFFYERMKNKPFHNLVFNFCAFHWLKWTYNWGGNRKVKRFSYFILDAYKNKAVGLFSVISLLVPVRRIKPYFDPCMQKLLKYLFTIERFEL